NEPSGQRLQPLVAREYRAGWRFHDASWREEILPSTSKYLPELCDRTPVTPALVRSGPAEEALRQVHRPPVTGLASNTRSTLRGGLGKAPERHPTAHKESARE